MSKNVLSFFREQEPRFKNVNDGELIDFIGREYPKFRADPGFERSYLQRNPPDSLKPTMVGDMGGSLLDSAIVENSALGEWDAAVKGVSSPAGVHRKQAEKDALKRDRAENKARQDTPTLMQRALDDNPTLAKWKFAVDGGEPKKPVSKKDRMKAEMDNLRSDAPKSMHAGPEWLPQWMHQAWLGMVEMPATLSEAELGSVAGYFKLQEKISEVVPPVMIMPGAPFGIKMKSKKMQERETAISRNMSKFFDEARDYPKEYSEAVEYVGRQYEGSEMARGIGASSGSLAPSLAVGHVGFGAMIVAAGVHSFGASYGDVVDTYREKGDPDAETKALGVATANGLITALTTAAFGQTGIEAISRGGANPVAKNAILRVMAEAGLEATEEGYEEMMQALVAKGTYQEDMTWQQGLHQIVAGMIGGAVLGGGVNALDTVGNIGKTEAAYDALGNPVGRFKPLDDLSGGTLIHPEGTPPTIPGSEGGVATPPPIPPPVVEPTVQPEPGGEPEPVVQPAPPVPPVEPEPDPVLPEPPAPEPEPEPVVEPPTPKAPGAPTAIDPSIKLDERARTGATTKVRASKDQVVPSVYAWIPIEDIHSSHYGPAFAQDPAFAPLRNTRDYQNDIAEQEKVMNNTQQFDPDHYVTNSKSAQVGPIMVSLGDDGTYRVMGGNGRFQMISRLEQSQALDLHAVQNSERDIYGLPPGPVGFLLVRILPGHSVSTQEGIDAANAVIDTLNPSESLREPVEQSARNDALHVTAEQLQQVSISQGVGVKRDFIKHLIAIGTIDRNSRQHIVSSESATTEYIDQLLFQVAFGDKLIASYYKTPRATATAKGIIRATADSLILLRRNPANNELADGFTQMILRMGEMERKYPDKPLYEVLALIGQQGELTETMPVKLGRQLAAVMSGEFEFYFTKANKTKKIEPEATLRNVDELLQRLDEVVRLNDVQQTDDIFGNERTMAEVVSDWLRIRLDNMTKDSAGSVGEPDEVFDEGGATRTWAARRWHTLMPGDLVRSKDAARTLIFRGWVATPADDDGRREAVFYDAAARGKPEVIPVHPSEPVASFSEDAPSYTQNDALVAWRKLQRKKDRLEADNKQLSKTEVILLEQLEKVLGQEFMAFWDKQRQTEQQAAKLAKLKAMELEAMAKKRLVAGAIETQQSLLGEDEATSDNDDTQMSFFSPEIPFDGIPISQESAELTRLGTLLNAQLIEAAAGKDVNEYSKVANEGQQSFTRTLRRSTQEDVVDAINQIGVTARGSAMLLRGLQEKLAAPTLMVEFEYGGIATSSAGVAIQQRQAQPSWGRMVTITPFQEVLQGGQEIRFSSQDNPIYIRQATRNELKMIVGSKPVNDAVSMSFAAWRENWSGQSAGVEMNKPQARLAFQTRVQQELGMSPEQFWRSARNGDAGLVNKLAEKPAKRREQLRDAGRAVGPINLRSHQQQLAGPRADEPDQLTLMAKRNNFGDGHSILPGFGDDILKPQPKISGNEPIENPQVEGPLAKARREGRQLQFGGLEPARKQRKRMGGSLPRREVITTRGELLPGLHDSQSRYTEKYHNLTPILREHQHEGVNRIIHAFNKGQDYGLFDGTGAGKTMQELAVAQIALRRFGSVLIITERQAIIDDAFAKDAETLGIPIYQFKGAKRDPGKIYIATYTDVTMGKIPRGEFGTVIWDEAHNLRGVDKSAKSHEGMILASEAQHNLYATATPLDRPEQLWYLQSLLDVTPVIALARIGIKTTYVNRNGVDSPRFEIERDITESEIVNLLENLFDSIYARGQAIKREVPLDNIEVGLKHVALSPDAVKDVGDKMNLLKRQYQHQNVPPHLISGIIMQAGRAELERYKVTAAYDQVVQSLAEGHQAIVFAYRIEPGIQGVGGAIGLLVDQLRAKYGRDSVGVLYGGASTIKARKYQQQMLKRFSDGDLKMIVGTPASGGTGINLDDVHGDAARDLILMTPPFSALEMVQIAGRINRLTTMSKARMLVLLTSHGVDRWNIGISLAKMGRLGAAVKGDIEKLNPRQFLGASEAKFNERRGFRPSQMEFPWSAQGLQSLTGDLGRRPLRLAAWRIKEQVESSEGLELVGLKAETTEEIGAIAQATRNPAYEVHYFAFIKDGVIVGSEAVTTRMPHTTPMLAPRDSLFELKIRANRMGADSVVGWHNHPTGNIVPSEQDYAALKVAREQLGSMLKEYLVINETEFVTFDWLHVQNDMPTGYTTHDVPEHAVRKLTGEFGDDPKSLNLLGRKAADLPAVAELAEEIAKNPNTVVVLFQDANLRINAVAQVGAGDVVKADFPERLMEMARQNGGRRAFAFYEGMADTMLDAALENLYESGAFKDVVLGNRLMSGLRDGISSRPAAQAPELWFGQNTKDAEVLRLEADEKELGGDTMETPAMFWSASGYNPNTPRPNGSVIIKMGGMQHVKPVQMPELVKIASELMGELPMIRKVRKKGVRGMFTPKGNGSITLDWRIFQDQISAAKTLAHEIGHLMDYLPDGVMARGNILGRLWTLNRHLRNTFGESLVKNKEVRQELLDLTMFWKPWDEANSPASFNKYRRSSVELYADAISVLFNAPGLLEQLAPKFYNEFWRGVDRKPEVKEAIYNLQDFLSRGGVNRLEAQANSTYAGFNAGDEIMRRKTDERDERYRSWKGWRMEVMQHYLDRFYPALHMQRRAENEKGAAWAKGKDPRTILDEFGLRDTHNYLLVRHIAEEVIQPLEAEGFTLNDLGLYMMMVRISQGDRAAFGNPDGHTPLTAAAQLMALRDRLGGRVIGQERMTALDHYARRFRGIIHALTREAVKVGAYNKETWEKEIEPNKETYVSFGILHHLQDYVSAGVKRQQGTFAKTANPVMVSILKGIAINNLISIQKAKNSVVDGLLKKYYPNEIQALKPRKSTGQGSQWVKPDPDKGILERLENGKVVGYAVDPFIAEMFEKLYPGQLGTVARFADRAFKNIFYPLIITYNPAFMLIFSPGRDFQRSARNLRAHGVKFAHIRLAKNMVQQFLASRRRLKGTLSKTRQSDQIVREAEDNLAFAMPWDSFATQHRDDHFKRVLKRYGMAPNDDAKGFFRKLGKKFRAPLDWVEFYGMVLDNLPKQAAFRILTKGKMQMAPQEAAGVVRNYIGLPNIHMRGTEAQSVKALVPFWNVAAQGWRADARLMRSPKTAVGWWLSWAMKDGILALLKGLAQAGLLGAALKAMMEGISEYEKTNYHTIPVGYVLGGDFGRKTRYIRVPMDETSRLLSGMIYKIGASMGDEGGADGLPVELLDFGADQVPGMNTAIEMSFAWGQYAVGVNPYDPFYGRPAVPKAEHEAGGMASHKAMLQWTLEGSGAMNFVHWDPEAQSTTELVVSAIPGINRMFKTSDYGHRERQLNDIAAENREHQRLKVQMADNVRGALGEYFILRRVGDDRTEVQEDRYQDLNTWYYSTYRRKLEEITNAEEFGDLTPALRKEFLDGLSLETDAYRKAK